MQVVSDNSLSSAAAPVKNKLWVVDGNRRRGQRVADWLEQLGFDGCEHCGKINELCLSLNHNKGSSEAENCLLLLYLDTVTKRNMAELQGLLDCHPMPVLLLIDDIDIPGREAAMSAGVGAFLSLGLMDKGIHQAMDTARASFAFTGTLRQQICLLSNRLQERVLIDKAKGLVMKNRGLDEAQAYSFLRDYAMRHRKKLVDVAQMTIDTCKLLNI